jgi:lysophospholipase L1-like esterase
MRRLVMLVLITLGACGDESQKPVATNGLVVFIGDSITQLWPVENFVEGAVNQGMSGDETSQMLARFNSDVLSRRPAVVVILGGINDIRNHLACDTGNLLAMVQAAQAANIGVVVGTLPDATNLGAESDLKRAQVVAFNEEIRSAATVYGYEVADYFSVTRQSGARGARKFSDGLHPNKTGYSAMWTALQPALDKVGVLR